jgi:enoyl-CoA hydratase/carnithine racemase
MSGAPPTAPSATAAEAAGVLLERDEAGVATIRLNRPERLNALGVAMVEALRRAVEQATDATVLVIRGTGRSFSAGADLKERRGMDAAARWAHNRAINAAADAIEAAPMPTIAALNGLALGGGCELALACDLRIAADIASIGLTEARIGAIPGAGGTQRLPRLIGTSRALELMLTGEPVTAARAAEIGLVNAVVPAEAFDTEVARLAALIASRAPGAATVLKRVVRQGMELPLAQGLAIEAAALPDVLASSDYAEGLAAFAERRPPRFSRPEDRR